MGGGGGEGRVEGGREGEVCKIQGSCTKASVFLFRPQANSIPADTMSRLLLNLDGDDTFKSGIRPRAPDLKGFWSLSVTRHRT